MRSFLCTFFKSILFFKFGQEIPNRAIRLPFRRQESLGIDDGGTFLVPGVAKKTSLTSFHLYFREGFVGTPATKSVSFKCDTRRDEETEGSDIIGRGIQ